MNQHIFDPKIGPERARRLTLPSPAPSFSILHENYESRACACIFSGCCFVGNQSLGGGNSFHVFFLI
jgi:hypothetical protein